MTQPSRNPEQLPTAEPPPIGSKWHQACAAVYEVRGHVDDQAVIRQWRPEEDRWVYDVRPFWVFNWKFGFMLEGSPEHQAWLDELSRVPRMGRKG